MSALYPDVPDTLGVPTVLRIAGVPALDQVASLLDLAGMSFDPAQWGVFGEDGSTLLDVDSVIAVDYQTESTISDYPVEEGSFVSYNKVDRPYESRVRVAKSGDSASKGSFLAQLMDLKKSTDLCTIVTPDITYDNANVVRYDYARGADAGAQMIVAELHLEEVRQTATAAYSNTRDPASADAVNDGAVQSIATTDPYGDPI